MVMESKVRYEYYQIEGTAYVNYTKNKIQVKKCLLKIPN